MRKIVVMRPHEWLMDSFQARSFAAAAPELRRRETPGMRFIDEPVAPVPVMTPTRAVTRSGSEFTTPLGRNYMVVADFDSEQTAEAFSSEDVEGVYADPEIGPFPVSVVCPGGAVGDVDDVKNQISIAPLHVAGHKGQGVRIAVVDTGIDGGRINVAGGLNLPGFPAPGMSPADHGTMVAFDALIAAPNAMIWDYPLLKSVAGSGWIGFLSDAIRIYAELLVQVLQVPGPMVVVNSWGMYDQSQDRPVGHPQNYSANPRHPFNQIVSSLVGAGADVVFAVGNCGTACPDGRCGINDRGPGKSIHGANSHPDAISVAAVTHSGDLLGYSSEGPGGLHAQKPDIAATSHFTGSGVFAGPDSGTSAACPVAAGVVAALRSKPSAKTLLPPAMKVAVLTSAVQPPWASPGWNAQTGFGVVDAGQALALV